MTTQVMPVIGSISEVFENPDGLYEGDLRWYFPIIASAPNVNAPYHNLRHMLHTTFLCYSALLYYKESGVDFGPRGRKLLIAALFHDYGHLAGKAKSDQENIDEAVAGLCMNIHNDDRKLVRDTRELIVSTHYPYKRPAQNYDEDILRDADKAQALSTAWIQQIGVGLATEMNISMEEMLRKQVFFLSNLRFETSWGKFMFAEHIPAKIEETQRVLRLL